MHRPSLEVEWGFALSIVLPFSNTSHLMPSLRYLRDVQLFYSFESLYCPHK